MKKLSVLIGFMVIVLNMPVISNGQTENKEEVKKPRISIISGITGVLIKDNSSAKIIRRIPAKDEMELEKIFKEQVRGKLKKYESAEPEISNPRIEFFNDSGRVIKSVSLMAETTIVIKKKKESHNNKEIRIKQVITKNVKMSGNGKFLCLVINKIIVGEINEKGEENLFEELIPTCVLKVYNSSGNIIWEKSLPEGMGVSLEPRIADNGEILAILTRGDIDEEARENIFAYKNGKEILKVPSLEDKNKNPEFHVNDVEAISPNGKYLAVSINYGTGSVPTITRFYNLFNKKFWDASENYVVYEIKDNGLAKTGSKHYAGKEDIIDLKKNIGD